jgi:hypothetical protein
MATDLPEIEDIRRVTYNPDDVIVVRLKGRADVRTIQRAADQVRGAFPDQKILVLDESASLDVVAPE